MAVELWLTKLEQHIAKTSVAEVRSRLSDLGLSPRAAAFQGGLLTSLGEERLAHWSHFQKRLELLQALGVGVVIVAPDFHSEPDEAGLARALDSLAAAAEAAGPFGVRLALEFSRTGAFCTSLDTAVALVTQTGAKNLGVCLDLFHYYTGPSKFEDLGFLHRENLAWVQVCDLVGTPRELARDSDRVLPGDGDFQVTPILEHLQRIGYDGPVSLEVTNPSLWEMPVDRVADVAYQALQRILPRLTAAPPGEGA
jgi:sugar phosphate isomerase/epimerase